MANLRISQLPSYDEGTNPDIWFVNNNSGETETFKLQLKDFSSLINSDGVDSVVSAPWLTTYASSASTEGTVAIGDGNQDSSAGSFNVLLGHQNGITGNAERTIVIGDANTVSGTRNVVLSDNQVLAGDNMVVIGGNVNTFNEPSPNGTFINSFNGSYSSTNDWNSVINSTDITIEDPRQFVTVIGMDNFTPAYNNRLYTEGIHTRKGNSMNVGSTDNTSTYETNFQSRSCFLWEVSDYLCGWTATNLDDGARYRVIFKNTSGSSWDIDPPIATGYTVYYEPGGTVTLADGTATVFYLDVVGTDIFLKNLGTYSQV